MKLFNIELLNLERPLGVERLERLERAAVLNRRATIQSNALQTACCPRGILGMISRDHSSGDYGNGKACPFLAYQQLFVTDWGGTADTCDHVELRLGKWPARTRPALEEASA